jgi:AAA15 family ATPase/GTPase
MIEKIAILQYRKLKNLIFEFSKTINVISGANGTCKTSILHLISNAFQSVNRNCKWVNDVMCLEVINGINNSVNSKVESLTKGDKKYNDPAKGVKGSLFSVDYGNSLSLGFRRHNSKKNDRYAVKPFYAPGTKESLPFLPVIYLGLSRLLPYGEFQDENAIEHIQKSLPLVYQKEVIDLYEKLTRISVSSLSSQKMGNIKTRTDFTSENAGIDSNTISAGEDNIFIILNALASLKYYFNSITSQNAVESILLIDEFDATLHPSLQTKLLTLFAEFSANYKIQLFFTTHSLSLIETAISRKDHVIYLVDNIDQVSIMAEPDIYKIKMNLLQLTGNKAYLNRRIPVFTEDEEARIFLEIIFEYFSESNAKIFTQFKDYFHFVDIKIGSTNLVNIFEDRYLIDSTMRSICILDGDHASSADYRKYIIALPGDKSPEEVIFDYSIKLSGTSDPFWDDPVIQKYGFFKAYYIDNIKPDIDNISSKIVSARKNGKSTKGITRDLNKKVFNGQKLFFSLLFKHWVRNPENSRQMERFYKDIHVMFLKTAEFHGINPRLWED